MGVTRITRQAAIRLGLPQSVTEAYRVRLKLSCEPRFVLLAEGVGHAIIVLHSQTVYLGEIWQEGNQIIFFPLDIIFFVTVSAYFN